jgi:hypothetical protein
VATVRKSTEVRAEPSAVLAVLLDVEAYADWEREVRSVTVHERDEQGRPRSTTLRVGTGRIGGYYTVAYDYPDASTVVYRLTDSDLMSRHEARFSAVASRPGSTRFEVQMDLALRLPMPRILLDRWVTRSVDNLLTNVRARAERG